MTIKDRQHQPARGWPQAPTGAGGRWPTAPWPAAAWHARLRRARELGGSLNTFAGHGNAARCSGQSYPTQFGQPPPLAAQSTTAQLPVVEEASLLLRYASQAANHRPSAPGGADGSPHVCMPRHSVQSRRRLPIFGTAMPAGLARAAHPCRSPQLTLHFKPCSCRQNPARASIASAMATLARRQRHALPKI